MFLVRTLFGSQVSGSWNLVSLDVSKFRLWLFDIEERLYGTLVLNSRQSSAVTVNPIAVRIHVAFFVENGKELSRVTRTV